jgi:hypothetical protein
LTVVDATAIAQAYAETIAPAADRRDEASKRALSAFVSDADSLTSKNEALLPESACARMPIGAPAPRASAEDVPPIEAA